MAIGVVDWHQDLGGELVAHRLFNFPALMVRHVDERETPLVVRLLQVMAELMEQREVVAARRRWV